jgi:single-strand DNA-binding protein
MAATEEATGDRRDMGSAAEPDVDGPVNEVRLVGVLAAAPEQRELPSGDLLVVFRVVVRRPDSADRRGRRAGPFVDTIDCAVWRGDVRRVLSTWGAGDVIEVHGALRRRFWRGPHGPASRCEVVVSKARRVSRAAMTT